MEDSKGEKASQSLQLVITAAGRALELTTEALPAGTEGQPYSAPIVAAHGSGSGYRWLVTAGELPPGLVLAGEGTPSTTLSGTPSSAGEFAFSITVTDSEGGTAAGAFTVTVAPEVRPLLTLQPIVLPGGTVGQPYDQPITASGGTATGYTWSVVGGALPPGLSVAPTGTPSTALVGTPTANGLFEFEVQVTDEAGATARATTSIVIARPPPSLGIITRSLPHSTEGQTYTATITASDGSRMGYTWRVSAGELPPGLSLDATGTPSTVLSGVTTTPGSYAFTIEVRDSAHGVGTQALTIEVARIIPPVQIATATLPDGVQGVAYDALLETVPGSGTGVGYNWLLTAGALPPGLTLQQSGTPNSRISGTPTGGGLFTFTVAVFDSDNRMDSQTYEIDVFRPLEVVTQTLPVSQTGTPYAATITAGGGGGGDFQWSIVQGGLPMGLALAPSGTPSTTLAGTPTESGEFSFQVRVQDDLGASAIATFNLTVIAGLTITTASLPDGRAGGAYVATLEAIGGTSAGYVWAVSGGALPRGWGLTSGTPTAMLSGTSTVAGSHTFQITVTDSGGGSATAEYTVELRSGDRFVAWVGDTRVDALNEVFVAGIPGLAPTQPQLVSPIVSFGAAVTTAATNSISPDGTKLVFAGDYITDARNELFLVDLSSDVPGPAQRVSGPFVSGAAILNLYWSPDSQRLMYRADQDVDNVNEFYLVDLSGPVPGTPIRLNGPMVNNGDVTAAKWSPDGSRISYRADEIVDEVYELFVVDVGGPIPGAPQRVNQALVTGGDVNTNWVWTPDGGRLVYYGDAETDDVHEAFIVDVSGAAPGTPQKLNGPLVTGGDVGGSSTTVITDLLVSPDGQWVSYVADQHTDNIEEVYVVNIGGAVPGPSIRVSGPAQSFTDNINVKWSPVDAKLAYVSDQEGSSVYEVYYVDLTSGAPAPAVKIHPTMPSFGRVAAGEAALQWSSDGVWIGYRADTVVDNAFQIEVVNVSGPTPAAPMVVVPPRVTGFTIDAFSFAPDGSAIAARGEGSVDNHDEIFVTPLSGPNAGVVTSITGPPAFTSANVTTFEWVGDSQHILARGDLTVDNRFEAYLFDVTAPVAPPVGLEPNVPVGGNVTTLIVRAQ